jgi:membrane-anchored protein YejM (alkaline phosphatase superfamily)
VAPDFRASHRGRATAKNAIRLAISAVIVLLIAVSVTGWIWTGGHQLATDSRASRVVLALAILFGVAGLVALWRDVRRGSRPGRL